jgi:transposase
MHLLPLRIVPAAEYGVPGTAAVGAGPTAKRRRAGVIEIELNGGIRVKVNDDVSAAALRRVISVLRG